MKAKIKKIKGTKRKKVEEKTPLLLKLKSLVYKYTGIYLAHREENKMLTSDETWKQMVKIASYKSNDMSLKTTQGLMIGLWQAKHGFARPWFHLPSKIYTLQYKYKFLRPVIRLVENVGSTLIVIKWDIHSLIRKFKK